MLHYAKNKAPHLRWLQRDIHDLDLDCKQFDGATCILATHHFQDLHGALTQIYNSMNKGRFVLFTILREQMQNYWLHEYFPETMRRSCLKFKSFEENRAELAAAGFVDIEMEKYFVSENLVDQFIHAGKHRPELYLNDDVMKGISCFNLWDDLGDEIERGRKAIKADISTGRIQSLIEAYDDHHGDYCYIRCEKR